MVIMKKKGKKGQHNRNRHLLMCVPKKRIGKKPPSGTVTDPEGRLVANPERAPQLDNRVIYPQDLEGQKEWRRFYILEQEKGIHL